MRKVARAICDIHGEYAPEVKGGESRGTPRQESPHCQGKFMPSIVKLGEPAVQNALELVVAVKGGQPCAPLQRIHDRLPPSGSQLIVPARTGQVRAPHMYTQEQPVALKLSITASRVVNRTSFAPLPNGIRHTAS
jgi:hypothetical protein